MLNVLFSNFSCPPKSSRLFQYPQFPMILNHHIANNSSVSFLDSSIIQSRPGSSRILSHPRSSISKEQTMLVCLCQTPHIYPSGSFSSMILYHQEANNASLFQTLILQSRPCSSRILTPPRSSLLQDPHSSMIITPPKSLLRCVPQ